MSSTIDVNHRDVPFARYGFPLPPPGALVSDDTIPLLQGTLDLLILQALASGPLHGYGVVDWVRRTTDDALQIEDGALYAALHRMRARGWLEAEWGVSPKGRRAKFYALTSDGEAELVRGRREWRAYTSAVDKVFAAGGGTAS